MNENSLKEIVEKYRYFGGIKSKNIKIALLKNFYNILKINLMNMRAIYLMEMYSADSNEFFDIPSVPSLFKCIHSPVLKAVSKFPPMFVQSISYHIKSFCQNPEKFAEAVIIYFEDDHTFHHLFAYSTFPAIYSYFLSDELCDAASKFLCFFFSNSRNLMVSTAFLASFFSSIPVFYQFFLSSISQQILTYNKSTPFYVFFDILKKNIILSLPLMTRSHIQAFISFSNTFPEESESFFVEKVLIEHYLAFKDASEYFSQPKASDSFYQFLIELKSNPMAKEITSIVKNQKMFQSTHVSLSGIPLAQGIQYAVCNMDMRLIHEILSNCTLYKYSLPFDSISFSDSLLPLSLEVYPDFLSKNVELPDFCESLFGDIPSEIKLHSNIVFQRVYNQIVRENHDIDLLLYFQDNEDNGVFKDSDFREFFLTNINNLFCESLKNLEHSILLSQQLKQMKGIKSSIFSYMQVLFHRFSFNFMKQIINGSPKTNTFDLIKYAINSVIGECKIPNKVMFELSCTVLDSLKINFNDSLQKLSNKFQNLLDNWAEENWANSKNNTYISERIIYLLNTSSILSNLGELGQGKRLILIIRFMKRLRMILGEDWNKTWSEAFPLVLFAAKEPHILPTFLFYYHFIFGDEKLVGQWGTEIHDLWEIFSACMWKVMKINTGFFLVCSDPNHMKNVVFDIVK